MFEEANEHSFQPFSDLPEAMLEPSCEVSSKATQPSVEVRPKSAKELADEYGVSDKSIQGWFKTVAAAYLWLDSETLKTGKSAKTRYTALCQVLIAEYRVSAANLSEEDWILSVHAANPEKLAAASPAAPSACDQTLVSPTEVMPSTDGERSLRFPLHLGSSLTLPSIASIITPGDDTAYLMQTQQRMQQFEALQQQVITQMQQQHEQAQALNAQYQEATSLNDQLLLQEFQLKGVQLGYAALRVKQQAFKATIQSVETGAPTAPGKP